MSKRQSSMDIHDIMNDINMWLDNSDVEAEDNLNEVNGDEENEKILQSERILQNMKLILIVKILVLLKIELST